MSRSRTILLVDSPDLDGDEAIARTESIARATGSSVVVLAAVGFVPSLMPGASLDVPQLVLEECAHHARTTAASLRERGVSTDVSIRVGVPIVEIVREVLKSNVDLVVKLEGGKMQRRSRFGSLDFQLLRKCPCAVLLCRLRERLPYRCVAAAVDPSDSRGDRDFGLDGAILGWAAELARIDEARLLAYHAFDFPMESFLRFGRCRLPSEQLDRMIASARDASRARLDSLIATHDHGGVRPEPRFLDGPPDTAIPNAVDADRADLLVLGTVARSGIAGLLIGNTSEEVVRDVRCAVLAVKPAGFVSPIRPE